MINREECGEFQRQPIQMHDHIIFKVEFLEMLKKITFTIASELNLWHPEEEQATLS
jgi:hypothetical protein